MSDKIETIDVGEVNWNKTAVQYMELNKQKTEAIQRVRELHKPRIASFDGSLLCIACESFHEHSGPVDYPCPTIKALNGEIGSVEPVKLEALDGEQG
jgi:hypothetical protein